MSKKCEYDNCINQATYFYNDNNWNVKYCKDHKNIEENLIHYKNKYNLCVSCCSIVGSFVYENNKKNRFCVNCKTDDMISLNNKCKHNIRKSQCKECGGSALCKANKQGILCLQIANKKYNNYCAKCFSNLYPDNPLSLNIRTKSFENKVRDFININYQDFQHNKLLNIGGCDCSHRRFIDHHIIINGCLLAFETDENQHKGYDNENEDNRINDIMMAYTSPHYFIRFSPNGNYIKDGKKSNPQFATRLKVLNNEIDKAIKFINSEKIYEKENLITNKYLFYDNK
jgi:hypothetical protein